MLLDLFFFFRALLVSEGVLHLLWRFGVWWIEFLQTFYLTGCIATAPIPGYRTWAAASAIWKTAYPLRVACSAEAFDHKAHGNGASFIIYSLGASQARLQRKPYSQSADRAGEKNVSIETTVCQVWVPWLFVRKICLHCKQLITLRDRSDFSNLSHLEVEVTHGWHERPLFAIINHPVIIPSLYRHRKNSFDLKKNTIRSRGFFFSFFVNITHVLMHSNHYSLSVCHHRSKKGSHFCLLSSFSEPNVIYFRLLLRSEAAVRLHVPVLPLLLWRWIIGRTSLQNIMISQWSCFLTFLLHHFICSYQIF